MPSTSMAGLRAWPAALVLCSFASTAWCDYSAAVKDLNPVAYWRLGETSGTTANDSSGNGRTGTYVGAVALGQTGALIADTDTAASFNGSDSYVEIPHNDSMRADNGTVQFWFKQAGSVAKAGLLSKDSMGYGTGGHLTARIDGSTLVVRLQSVSDTHTVSSGPLQAERWYLVTFTYGAAGMKLYMDDQLADTNGYVGGMGTTSGGAGNYEPVVLGANSWASEGLKATPLTEHFSGVLDEVVIFDQALSVAQIEHLHQLATVPEPATVAMLTLGGLLLAVRRRRRWRSRPASPNKERSVR